VSAEFYSGAMYNAEHAPLCFRPSRRLIDPDPMNGGDDIVVNGPERCDQARNALGAAGVFIPPWACRMKAQHAAGEFIGQNESP
jgi:hypothetical protein